MLNYNLKWNGTSQHNAFMTSKSKEAGLEIGDECLKDRATGLDLSKPIGYKSEIMGHNQKNGTYPSDYEIR
ncbi:hypothetical protein [Paenibacillus sp. ISL-20]|uniref:hypothetical protein n=1 Tax=Paenibacillus sp. ISL-20 TaxID=2819163 RepID=UPI001BE8273F|nr:hypothetical protein [Paenibacillus sp. ISL-20]